MTALILQGAPGCVVKYSGQRNDPRKADDTGGAPRRQKTVHLLLEVTDDRFRKPLLAIFPGSDLMMKAMGADPKGSSATLTMAKVLDDVSVVVTAVDGSDVFSGQVCKVSGKPTLRIGPGAKKIELPVVVRVSLDRDTIRRIDDMLGADAVINVQTAQSDIEDKNDDDDGHAGDAPETEKKPKKNSKAGKTTVPIIDGGAEA